MKHALVYIGYLIVSLILIPLMACFYITYGNIAYIIIASICGVAVLICSIAIIKDARKEDKNE